MVLSYGLNSHHLGMKTENKRKGFLINNTETHHQENQVAVCQKVKYSHAMQSPDLKYKWTWTMMRQNLKPTDATVHKDNQMEHPYQHILQK